MPLVRASKVSDVEKFVGVRFIMADAADKMAVTLVCGNCSRMACNASGNANSRTIWTFPVSQNFQ
jgi:hypothetical protein